MSLRLGLGREEVTDLVVMGIGSGASGAVAGWVKNFMPGVTEDIAVVVAGGLMYLFGGQVHPLVRKFGAGVLINGIGGFTKGIIPAPTPPEGQGGSQGSSSSSDTLASLAQAQANRKALYS